MRVRMQSVSCGYDKNCISLNPTKLLVSLKWTPELTVAPDSASEKEIILTRKQQLSWLLKSSSCITKDHITNRGERSDLLLNFWFGTGFVRNLPPTLHYRCGLFVVLYLNKLSRYQSNLQVNHSEKEIPIRRLTFWKTETNRQIIICDLFCFLPSQAFETSVSSSSKF